MKIPISRPLAEASVIWKWGIDEDPPIKHLVKFLHNGLVGGGRQFDAKYERIGRYINVYTDR